MVIISSELTRVHSDRNIFSIKWGTNIYLLTLWDLVHYHHQNFGVLNNSLQFTPTNLELWSHFSTWYCIQIYFNLLFNHHFSERFCIMLTTVFKRNYFLVRWNVEVNRLRFEKKCFLCTVLYCTVLYRTVLYCRECWFAVPGCILCRWTADTNPCISYNCQAL